VAGKEKEMNEQNGAWVITKVYSKAGIPIDVKSWGQDTAAAIDDLYKGIAHGIEKYGWATEQANAPKPAAPAAPPPAGEHETKTVTDSTINTMLIKRVSVAPQTDGKIKVGMFADGHKYPDLYMTMGLDAALKALSGTGHVWDAEYLSKPAEFDMSFYADWRNSDKLNSKGNPYKNIVNLRPLEATA